MMRRRDRRLGGGGKIVKRHLIRLAYTLSALAALVLSLGAGRKWQ